MMDTLSCEGCQDLGEIDSAGYGYCMRFHKYVFNGNLRPHQCLVAALAAANERVRELEGKLAEAREALKAGKES